MKPKMAMIVPMIRLFFFRNSTSSRTSFMKGASTAMITPIRTKKTPMGKVTMPRTPIANSLPAHRISVLRREG